MAKEGQGYPCCQHDMMMMMMNTLKKQDMKIVDSQEKCSCIGGMHWYSIKIQLKYSYALTVNENAVKIE